jgi:hypothetical protein
MAHVNKLSKKNSLILKRNGREKVVPGEKKKEALALQQYGDRNLPVSQ